MPKPTDSQLKCSILLKSSFYPILFSKNPARLSLSRHSDRVKRRYTSGTVHEHDVSGRLS